MDPRFLRNLAQQARNLLPVARTDFARAQPRIWIAEFDSLAQITERDALTARLCSIDPSGGGQQAVERQPHQLGRGCATKEAGRRVSRFRSAGTIE